MFRDIYPQEFYDKIINRKLCVSGRNMLDIGTETGAYETAAEIAPAEFDILHEGAVAELKKSGG